MCEILCQRRSSLGDDKARGVDLRVMAEAVAKVIQDETIKGLRGKDVGLVILGPQTSSGILVGRL